VHERLLGFALADGDEERSNQSHQRTDLPNQGRPVSGRFAATLLVSSSFTARTVASVAAAS
jgi:hypothetical protein